MPSTGMLTKIHIQNYRVFENLTLDFTDGLNVIVGNNDAGKSTLLEAVHLALTSRVRGRLLATELSPHMFNQVVSKSYLEALASGGNPPPPEIIIDLFLEELEETATLKGTNNSSLENVPGLRIRVHFWEDFSDEYASFVANPDDVRLVPAEYYKVDWLGFNGNSVTARSVPATASMIDASAIRLQSGADHYLQQIISDHLEPKQRVEIARAYRTLRETFTGNDSIEAINVELADTQEGLTDRELSLAIDISQRTAWESNLVPHLDDLPCQFVGSGAQNMLKVLLALNRTADACHVVLIEEPENHQAPASLNALVGKIADRCQGKQVLVTTHSSFVLNKLGLDKLVLLTPSAGMRLTDLPKDTLSYFKRLPGYDTLRVALADRIILVEGPSDELVVQRAFHDVHGKLPLEAGVDVISVRGLSFKRFLDIAKPLGKRVAVVTDNDGKDVQTARARYSDYTDEGKISVHVGDAVDGKTLEPQLVSSCGRSVLNGVFGTDFASDSELAEYMTADKTACALQLFESTTTLAFPSYIRDAVTI
jgi:putative ATP-dependent endonuclease of OLD family